MSSLATDGPMPSLATFPSIARVSVSVDVWDNKATTGLTATFHRCLLCRLSTFSMETSSAELLAGFFPPLLFPLHS